MASNVINDILNLNATCRICFQLCEAARKLPDCSHVFCEKCIRTHVTDNKTAGEFICPLCRYSYNEDLIAFNCVDVGVRMEEKAEPLVKDLCVSCEELGKANGVERYCYDCQANLCKPCCKMIHAMKTHKDHCNVDVSQGGMVNDTETRKRIQELLTCSKHPDKTVGYECKEDNDFCCSDCAFLHHRNCREIIDLNDNEEAKQTDEESKILANIKELCSHIEAIIITNSSADEEPKNPEIIVGKIREMRAKINSTFDALEENVSQACKAQIKTIALSVTEENGKLQNVLAKLKECRSFIKEMTDQLPSRLVNAALLKLKQKIKEYETAVLEINHGSKKRCLELEVGDVLNTIINVGPNETNILATVRTKETKLDLPEYSTRSLIKYCAISKVANLSVRYGYIKCTGMVALSNNHLILVDSSYGCIYHVSEDINHSVEVFDFMTINTNKTKDTRKPYSATDMKNGMVAISLPSQKKIYFVSVDKNLAVKGEYYTKYSPKAIQRLKNGDLAVSWEGPVAFGLLALNGYSYDERIYFDRDANGRIFQRFDYMAVDEKRAHIIQPCSVDKAVYCFDFQGRPMFTYSHQNLSYPSGVAIDHEGNIFVCDNSESVIHVLSEHGQLVRLIKEGCPEDPVAITFMRSGGDDGTGSYYCVTNTSSKWAASFNVTKYQICGYRLIPSGAVASK